MLYLLGKKPKENQTHCPKTYQILKGVPNLIQAFFSIMDPQKSVPLHKGPYLGYLRYHLGIKVPKDNPPSIIVKGQPYTWQNGEHVIFDDSYPHEVVNESKEPRVILIIDIQRPMPFLPSMLNKFAVNVLAKHTYGRSVMNRVKKFKDNNGILTLR